MNVLYEDTGAFKIGTVLAEHDASLHVEAPHGKRAKIKSANVLLRFDEARLDTFLEVRHKWDPERRLASAQSVRLLDGAA